MSDERCVKCGVIVRYSVPDTVWLAVVRRGEWPEWSYARCVDGGLHRANTTLPDPKA
jgi:hypothetical protein